MRSRLLAALTVAALALVAALTSAGPASAIQACPGTIVERIDGKWVRAEIVERELVGCQSAKRLVRRFFRKMDDSRRCRRIATQGGCLVGSYTCARPGRILTNGQCARSDRANRVEFAFLN